MNRKRRVPVTSLNESDRRILDKYTRFYTNFIESNTARNEALENGSYKPKT